MQEESEKGPEALETFAKKRVLRVKEDGRITVYIVSDIGKKAEDIDKEKLKSYGVEVIKSVGNTMKATLPIKMIRKVADEVEGISFIRLPDIPYSQTITTEGVSLTGASSYHSVGYTGAGVGIAIIDMGFLGGCAAALAGEIPGSTIFIDCTGSLCINKICPWDSTETTNHGTAVAEIIHDIAPGAQLYLLKIDDPFDAVTAYSFLTPGSVNVVNYSAGWYNQNFGSGECFYYSPFYQYNPVCLVNDAYAAEILWVNSAGNSAKEHYAATFSDPNGNGWHNVSANMEFISFTAQSLIPVDIYLTWDSWPITDQDYDLYLYDSAFNEIYRSETVQSGTQRPTEHIQFYPLYTGTYYIAIKKYSASINHRFSLFVPYHELTPHVASGSLLCPADATTAFTVGAIDLSESTWSPAGQIASYSSQGPTNDGRIKPEIVGPAHVSTYTLPGFDGTSAAAPHLAGAAALILSANPSYSVSQL